MLTNPEYSVTSRYTGEWTVKKRPITITALDETIFQGDTPALKYEITSGELVNGDLKKARYYAIPLKTIGTHAITQGTLTAGDDYEVTLVAGTLTVLKDVVEIDSIIIEGITSVRHGSNFFIVSQCGDNSADVEVKLYQPATVEINGVQQNPRKVDLPKNTNP